MSKVWRPYASYNLWSEFSAPVGQEHWHCDMKRGFARARKKEPAIKALLEQYNTAQKIGLLAQRGVYEFEKDPLMLYRRDAVEKVSAILQLNQQQAEVQQRVQTILNNYNQNPILFCKKIIKLNRGDEGFPEPIIIQLGKYEFNLFAAIDCIYAERDGRLHILDFKTGHSDFDRRQGYVYLLAASYLYPGQKAVASFYNLETGKSSDPITATPQTLEAFKIELAKIAQNHQKQLRLYKKSPAEFSHIFPANPGFRCKYCLFNSKCEFYESEVAA